MTHDRRNGSRENGSWGIAALTVETLIILLAAWQARISTTNTAPPHRTAGRRAPEYSRPG